uniref:Uncharacterized protein n=1 Tax=Utricularia reniformis TaxID=192314 RepID=A0A1Y0AZT0_9LAMI|nr:hypothetical protein AEK19_MT0397 [Utricularia reniformis]ART30667.1 hypothetical protein AEK19_MT0397 [Utricularia reniformis]
MSYTEEYEVNYRPLPPGMRIPSKIKRECVFPASMQSLPGPRTRAILGPTKA